MKSLVLGSIFTAGALIGCTTSSDTFGHVAATWSLDHVTSNGDVTPAACPSSASSAELHTVAASPDGVAVDSCQSANSDCYIDIFDCTDGGGVSAPLPAQNYLTWVEIVDNGTTYATSTAEFVDITDVDMQFDTDILVDGGYFKVSWSLQGETSGNTLACADTDAAKSAGGSVEVVSTLSTGGNALTDKYDCEDHFGYSAPLPWGTYTIVMDALNSSDQALGSESTPLGDHTIGSNPNEIVDLGHAVLKVSGQ
jgi:hypothetical protein